MLRAVAGIVLLLLAGVPAAQAQPSGLREPRALDTTIIHSGHSLTDPIPWGLGSMALAAGGTVRSNARSTIPGSPMWWRWEYHADAGPADARAAIGDYEVLSITQAAPIGPATDMEAQAEQLQTWYDHARVNGDGGRGADVYLYTTWGHVQAQPGYSPEFVEKPFRERLELEGARWEFFQDWVNARRPEGAEPVWMIPGHRMMMRIYDDLQTGSVPGAASMYDFIDEFSRYAPGERDGIHLTWGPGAYAIGLLHYAVIYRRDPRGLPNVLQLEEYQPDAVIPPALAAYLQEIAWEIATTYPRTGLRDASWPPPSQ